MKKVSALFITGFILLLGGCFQSDESADLILHNAKVLTVDNNFSVAEAVAIKGDQIKNIKPLATIVGGKVVSGSL
jgi:predicted amidohydrolase YtcJ